MRESAGRRQTRDIDRDVCPSVCLSIRHVQCEHECTLRHFFSPRSRDIIVVFEPEECLCKTPAVRTSMKGLNTGV